MKYWSNPYNHAMNSRAATLNMVAEFLSENGYRILQWSASPILVMRAGTAAFPSSWDKSLSYLRVCTLDSIAHNTQETPLTSYLVVVDESQINTWKKLLPESYASKTIVALAQEVDIARTVEVVGNYLISVQELCATLALAVSSSSLSQALINIAEDYFGCYMHITDANHMLIGYAHHIKPLDSVSKSLIKHKFHLKEVIENEGISIVNEALLRDGIKTYPPSELFPMGLVTKALRVGGQFAAYLVMQMDQEKLTPGTFDAIELFSFYLSKMLERRMGLDTRKDATTQNFLFHLIVDEGLSRSFVKDQCELIGFPSEGSYVLMEAQWDESYEMRVPTFAAELGNAPDLRLSLVFDGRVLVLFVGKDDDEVITAVQTAVSSQLLKTAQTLRLSDIYHSLLSTFYAHRTLRVIEEFEAPIDDLRKVGQAENSEKAAPRDMPKIYSFRDAFCLFWNDPASNDFLKRYALQHMLVTRIEENDQEKGTDNLAVLADYLTNERRISVTAQNTHMHRNGVIYRIKRIQAMYHIDFDDFLQRQYILIGLQIKISLGLNYQAPTEQFPESDLKTTGEQDKELFVRPDIPRDSDYDPADYMR